MMQPRWNLMGPSVEIIVVGTTGQAFQENSFLDCRPLFQPSPDFLGGPVRHPMIIPRRFISRNTQPVVQTRGFLFVA